MEGRKEGQQGVLKNRKGSKIYFLLGPGDFSKYITPFNI